MRALLYADWCVIRRYLAQYTGIAMAISAFIGFGTGGVGPAGASLTMAASAACLVVMLGYFFLYALFGADEQNGWEGARLSSLPVTPAQVVTARFALMGTAYAVLLVAGLPLSMLVTWVVTLAGGSPVLVVPDGEVLLALAGSAGAALVLSCVQMAVLFAVGMQRGRAASLLPFLLVMALNIPPVGEAARRLASWAASAASGASPAVIGLACVAGVAAVFAACLAVTRRVYARREF